MLTYIFIGFLIVIIATLAIALAYSVKRNLEFSEKFEDMGEQVEQSLDILNDCYQRIAKVAEKPVTTDDPVVQQLLADIKHTKNAILLVANKVVAFDEPEDEQE